MTKDEFRAMLMERRLSRVANGLLKLARPAVRVYVTPVDEESIPVGSSKMGGRTDLPTGTDWPT